MGWLSCSLFPIGEEIGKWVIRACVYRMSHLGGKADDEKNDNDDTFNQQYFECLGAQGLGVSRLGWAALVSLSSVA
jgi:hypothetical protein